MPDKGLQGSKRLWRVSSSNSFCTGGNQCNALTGKKEYKPSKIWLNPRIILEGQGGIRKKCSSAYLSMCLWGPWFFRQKLNHFASSSKTCFSWTPRGKSLSSFVYLCFLAPSVVIPQVVPHFLLEPNHATFRAQELEHGHAQEWSTNTEVGHVGQHLSFLETTTSKDHSPRDGEIKARWRSGLSFKYSLVYNGGGRREAEFWTRTHRRPSLPHPDGDSKQGWTQSKPRAGHSNYLLKSSSSEKFHHVVITFYTFSKWLYI